MHKSLQCYCLDKKKTLKQKLLRIFNGTITPSKFTSKQIENKWTSKSEQIGHNWTINLQQKLKMQQKKSRGKMEKIMHSLLIFLGISLYCFKKLWACQFWRFWIAFILSIAIEIPMLFPTIHPCDYCNNKVLLLSSQQSQNPIVKKSQMFKFS